jgi:hypothetical protein
VTPQVKIPYRLSAACAAAGVLMVMGGLAGGGSVNTSQAPSGQMIEAPLVNVVHFLPVSPQLAGAHHSVAAQSPVTPRPVEPQPPKSLRHLRSPKRRNPLRSLLAPSNPLGRLRFIAANPATGPGSTTTTTAAPANANPQG